MDNQTTLASLSSKDKARAVQLLKAKEKLRSNNQLREWAPYGWQEKLANASKDHNQCLAMCGNRCIPAWQPIEVYTQRGRESLPILKALYEEGVRVVSWADGQEQIANILAAYCQGAAPTYQLILEDGQFLYCTDEHRVLTAGGSYRTIRDLVFDADDLHCLRTDEDSLAGYVADDCQYDRPLRDLLDSARAYIPLLADALKQCQSIFSPTDAGEQTDQYNQVFQSGDLLSSRDDLDHFSALSALSVSDDALLTAQQSLSIHQAVLQLHAALSAHPQLSVEALAGKIDDCGGVDSNCIFLPKQPPVLMGGNKIIAWRGIGSHPVFDIQVPDYHNYIASGVVNHNCGKSYTGSRVLACHLTGLYPDWWEGKKFTQPISAWAAGASTVTTRDILQKELLGDPVDVSKRGTGSIPKDCIVDVVRKPQIPNAVESIVVKFHNPFGVHIGNSVVAFKSYEMGEEKFMGSSLDWIWLDEQPAQNIYTQCLTRTLDKKGYVMMTFTPESGMTPVIQQFMNDRKPGQFLIQATWDDAPHLDDDAKEQVLSQYLPNEREMRTRGIPVFGRGMVFPFSLERLVVEDFDIPANWPRISGIDFGFDHPTALVWGAINPENGCFYITDEYRESRQTPTIIGAAIKSRSTHPPIAWPHDGNRSFDGGDSLAAQYRAEGINLLPDHFTNPPDISQMNGDNKISAGIAAMGQAMEKGLFKVFKSCFKWQQEYGQYHFGENGKIVDKDDDLMAATRYAFQSQRFAVVEKSKSSTRFAEKPDYKWVV